MKLPQGIGAAVQAKQEWAPGDRVRCEVYLLREDVEPVEPYTDALQRRWAERPQPVEGILVGIRTYQDGVVAHDNEKGYVWVATNHRRVALVAVSLRERPVPVPLEKLERVE